MHKNNNFYISLGIWVAILPLLGIPDAWKNTLIILSGVFLILVALGSDIIKRFQIKNKPKGEQKESEYQDLQISEQEEKISNPTNNQMDMEK